MEGWEVDGPTPWCSLRPMRARSPWTISLAVLTAALAVWRGACILAGPDIDTDAYAHHMIARAILADPRDLAVHWVWLPLFHYAQVPLVALGGTMDDVRWANLLLTAALPWVLFAYVRRTTRMGEARIATDATALLAAASAALCPIVMQMGTTAQPEPLFALVVAGVAVTLEENRNVAAAGLLSAAVMLRYEAWGIWIAASASFAVEPMWRRFRGGDRAAVAWGRGPWIVTLAPAVLIAGWAILRRPVDGQWFGFLRQTQEFATGALGDRTGGRALWSFADDLLYYPIIVPVRVLGAAMPLVPFGVWRTVRQQGARFVLVFAACLGFVSLSWAKHGSLGLDRHFVAVVPLYATFAAQGVSVIADAAVRGARHFVGDPRASSVGRATAGVLAAASVVGLLIELDVWMGFWRGSIVRGLPDRAAIGAYLRSVPPSPTIFCDDATMEIASQVDRTRFDRHWVDDPHTWDLVHEAARASGTAYVATWRRKLRGHEQDGAIVFEAGVDPADQGGSGVAVMRVEADSTSHGEVASPIGADHE